MANKEKARIRRILSKGKRYIAFEGKVGDKWKLLAKDSVDADYDIPIITDFLTKRFMKDTYEIVDCDSSEHEW